MKLLDWSCIAIAAACCIAGSSTENPAWYITGLLFAAIALFLDVLDAIDERMDAEIASDKERDEASRRSRLKASDSENKPQEQSSEDSEGDTE